MYNMFVVSLKHFVIDTQCFFICSYLKQQKQLLILDLELPNNIGPNNPALGLMDCFVAFDCARATTASKIFIRAS